MDSRGHDVADRSLLWPSRERSARRQRLPRPGHGPFRRGDRPRPQEERHPRGLLRKGGGGGRRAGHFDMTATGPGERIVSGPLAVTLLRFGAPLALGMGLQTTFNLVDAYLISRLDAD